jgi:hypothetical protein
MMMDRQEKILLGIIAVLLLAILIPAVQQTRKVWRHQADEPQFVEPNEVVVADSRDLCIYGDYTVLIEDPNLLIAEFLLPFDVSRTPTVLIMEHDVQLFNVCRIVVEGAYRITERTEEKLVISYENEQGP